MGAFEALLEPLNAYPHLPGGAPVTVRNTLLGWKVFTRTEAVTALRLMLASSGRPHAVRAPLGKNRGGHPVSIARHLGITSSACRKMGVEGVYGM